MKKLLLVILLAATFSVLSQEIYNLDKERKEKITYTKSGDVAVYKGVTYPVYITKTNKKFIFVVSKNGKTYRKYIKV